MKCPLRWGKAITGESTKWLVTEDCLKEECAWWSIVDEECRIAGIDRGLKVLSEAVIRVAGNMPHEGQSRK